MGFLILSCIVPRPPRSALFPYTTLFRSKGALALTVAGVIVKILGAVYRIPLYGILGDVGMGLFMAVYPHPPRCHRGEYGDRKSTRLNSSHVRISYAVFCLKEKSIHPEPT